MPEIERKYLRGDPRRKRKKKRPTTNGTNRPTHDPKTGRFLPGNPGGPGNPFIHKVSALRAALLEEVNEAAIRKIVRQLISRAISLDSATGNHAARELLNRVVGKSPVDAEEQAAQSAIDNRFDPDERFD